MPKMNARKKIAAGIWILSIITLAVFGALWIWSNIFEPDLVDTLFHL
ncbi:MAG: hypothetical protein WHU54_00340 [Candidatus Bathyarchaeia archaeon]